MRALGKVVLFYNKNSAANAHGRQHSIDRCAVSVASLLYMQTGRREH